jgi:hypothetical protein
VNCSEIQNMTVSYLELDLDPDRVHQVTGHLEICLNCRNEMESVRQTLVRLKGRLVPSPGERFWTEFPDLVRMALLDARTDAQRPIPALSPLSRQWFPHWSWALAASVIVVLGALVFGAGMFGEKSVSDLLTKTNAPKSELINGGQVSDLADFAETDWDSTWDEDDSDMMLIDMAAGLDPRILDRLFKDI